MTKESRTPKDTPWLRETVPEELRELFVDEPKVVQRAVQRLLDRLPFDPELDTLLIETVQASLDQQNDDTDASLWMALILGEAGITKAISLLLRALANADREDLQHAASVALLKMGEEGVEGLVEFLEEEEPSSELSLAAYRILGSVGMFPDAPLIKRVVDLLRERLELDQTRPQGLALIEECALALARLGDRASIPSIERIHYDTFSGASVVLGEALEMLMDNDDGKPLILEQIPGEEDYRWIFNYVPDPKNVGEQEVEEFEADDEVRRLYRGVGAATDVDNVEDDERLEDEDEGLGKV